MTEEEVRKRAFAMPLTSPAFPPGPYRFVNREYLIITYRTDSAALEAVIPAPLEMTEPVAATCTRCSSTASRPSPGARNLGIP